MSKELLEIIMQAVIIPTIVAVGGFVVTYLNAKAKEIQKRVENEEVRKYVDIASDTVLASVEAVYQTYVEELKFRGEFDDEAKKRAFSLAKEHIKKILNTNAKEAIALLYGDINLWIDTKIEQAVFEINSLTE